MALQMNCQVIDCQVDQRKKGIIRLSRGRIISGVNLGDDTCLSLPVLFLDMTPDASLRDAKFGRQTTLGHALLILLTYLLPFFRRLLWHVSRVSFGRRLASRLLCR